MLLASGTLANGVSQAEEAVLIPGATSLQADQPDPYPIVADHVPAKIGITFTTR